MGMGKELRMSNGDVVDFLQDDVVGECFHDRCRYPVIKTGQKGLKGLYECTNGHKFSDRGDK